MKKDMTFKNKKKHGPVSSGFTLIELLATIAILSVILSVVIYFAIDIVNNAKNKSYQVTINNVETLAGNYALEDIADTIWMDGFAGSYQYQCVTVQNLIDTGYFSSDVLESKVREDRNVYASDYIYLERDKYNKNITKNVLLLDSSYSALCDKVTGLINMGVDYTGWSRKKNVTIKYNLYNVDSLAELNTYNYQYKFYSDFLSEKFDNKIENKSFDVYKNGTVYAYITDSSGNTIYSSMLEINKIDVTPPVGVIKSENKLSSSQSVSLELSDTESGVVEYYFGKSDPQKTNVTWKKITNTKSITIPDSVNSSGRWYLGVKDDAGNDSYVSKEFYNTELLISNASVTPSSVITMDGDSFTVPVPVPYENYVFVGWYDNDSYSGNVITDYEPVGNGTLYGKTEMSKFTVKINYSTNGGNVVSETTGKDGVTKYNWTTNGEGLILLNGGLLTTEIGFEKQLNSDGLLDWDNSAYLNITKTGHSAKDSSEWICLSGECEGKTYSDVEVYSASDFCDASESDCTVVLGPNWKVNTYTITYMANGGYSSRKDSYYGKQYCTYKPTKDNHDVEGTMAVQTCTYGESCTLTANAFKRQCHKFKGWTTNNDTDTVNYINSITSSDDTDAFYANKDNFIYNIDDDLTLYAVWQNDHDFSAIGNQVVETSYEPFTCGYIHGKYGAYVRYCSKCQMSAAHYDNCYRPAYSTGDEANHFCPCAAYVTKTYDDHKAFNSSGAILDKASWYSAYKFGGSVEGKSISVLGDGNLAALICGNHTTYTVTLDTQDGSGGTTEVYGVYYRGLYLSLDTKHGEYSDKMSTSSNKVTVPTRSGYIFGGYYTEMNGEGTQLISSSGYLTSNYNKTSYNSDMTLYAKWTSKPVIPPDDDDVAFVPVN